MGLGNRKAIYIPFPQAVPLKYTIDRKGTPPCTATCPLHCNAQGYVALISQGKLKELSPCKRKLLPGILAYVCPVLASGSVWIEIDRPISICDLEDIQIRSKSLIRFTRPKIERSPLLAAAIGITAAFDPRRMGYRVLLVHDEIGGLLTHGFRLIACPRGY
jgi:heterodisulfide reductase subunit A